MVKRDEIVRFLDEYLKISEINDSSLNGMQVEGRDDVKKIVLAVDACQTVFDEAKSLGADMILVHHGLFWGDSDPRIIGLVKNRVDTLLSGGITLYAAHLPLDLHPDAGNNSCISRIVGLKKIQHFGEYRGMKCGFYGELDREYKIDEFTKIIEKKIGKIIVKHIFGKDTIKTVGIISGGGAFAVDEVKKYKIDIMISGEQQHTFYNMTKELGANVLYLGHYHTEMFGVKAVGEKLKEKFTDLETIFVDNPTGL